MRATVAAERSILLIGRQLGLGRLEGTVRAVERQVGEEGAVVVRRQEIDRGGREDVAAVPRHLPLPAILLEDRIEVSAAARRVRRLVDAPALDHQRLLEALVDRPQGRVVAKVPLAEDPRAIAGRAEYLRQRHLVGGHQRASGVGIDDPRPVVIPARHQAGPRRRADRRDAEGLQLHALAGEPVEVRRLDPGIAVESEIAISLVVGHDEQDIGPPGTLRTTGPPGYPHG